MLDEFYLQDLWTNKLLNIKGDEKFIKITTTVTSSYISQNRFPSLMCIPGELSHCLKGPVNAFSFQISIVSINNAQSHKC